MFLKKFQFHTKFLRFSYMKSSLSPIIQTSLFYNTFSDTSPYISFDTIMEALGFGVYQMRIYLIMCLMALSEGAHIMAFTLMLPILKHQWLVTDLLNGLQASLIFLAYLIGSMISGQISDRIGRKIPSFYSIVFIAFFTMLSSWSYDIIILIIVRVMVGLLVGFFGPLGGTILTEITPKHLRGKYMTSITFCLVLGQLYAAFIGYFLLDNLDRGNWRVLLIFCSIPGILAGLLAYLFLDESPRYLMMVGKYDEAFEICEKISRENETEELIKGVLSKETKDKVISWAQNLEEEEPASMLQLFRGQKKIITPLLWTNWLTTSFIYYGIIIYIPLILQKIENRDSNSNGNDILQIFSSNFMELVSIIGAASLIENKYFGRKNSMIMFFALTSFVTFLIYFSKEHFFIILVTFARIFISMTFIFCFQYTSEVYETKIRTTGLGMANGIGRIGGVVMPWICAEMMQIDLYGPFIAFFLLSATSTAVSYWLPFDTREKDLDG